jgi:citronellol/citronellal dehydrogenase
MSQYRSVFKPGLFDGQVIIVTGGGSGIGRCTAHELASLGAKVILIGRKEEKLVRVTQEIEEDGGLAAWYTLDIRQEENVAQTIATILKDHGAIHHLVNNAGGQYPAPLSAINQKGFETVMRTNLVGGFLMAREVYNQHMEKHGGTIVNMIADMWNGMPMMGHSGAARSGMDNLTKTAALEWADSGVRVNAIAPGWIASSGMDTYNDALKAIIPSLKKAVPLKRMGEEAEVSGAIAFLLSPAAAFITGTTLCIDGAAPMMSTMYPTPDHNNSQPFNGFHRAVKPQVLQEDTHGNS